MIKSLDSIPCGKMPKWGQTARFLINTKQKLGLRQKKKRKKELSNDWAELISKNLHFPVKRIFPRRRIISYGIDEIWSADLVETQ